MAIAKDHVIFDGFSGKLGPFSLRQRQGGRTQIVLMQGTNPRTPSEAQELHQARFKAATVFAKVWQTDPLYIEIAGPMPDVSAYNLAVRDYMRPPDIDFIDIDEWSNSITNVFSAVVLDAVPVPEITCVIFNRDTDEPLIGGPMIPDQNVPGLFHWSPPESIQGTSLPSLGFRVTAVDRAENTAELAVELPAI